MRETGNLRRSGSASQEGQAVGGQLPKVKTGKDTGLRVSQVHQLL